MFRLVFVLAVSATAILWVGVRVLLSPSGKQVRVIAGLADTSSAPTLDALLASSEALLVQPGQTSSTAGQSVADQRPALLDRRIEDYGRELREAKLDVLEAARALVLAVDHCERSAFENALEWAGYYTYSPSIAALGQSMPQPADWNFSYHIQRIRDSRDKLDAAVRRASDQMETIRTRFVKEFDPLADQQTVDDMLPIPKTEFDHEIGFAIFYLEPRLQEFVEEVSQLRLDGSSLGFAGRLPEPFFILDRYHAEFQSTLESEGAELARDL